ncbi:MAG: hypothetical protein IPL65_17090 [Lewinellaceae bacterium]|nr:hypothetical protein [Lewinellaceae bacterium]
MPTVLVQEIGTRAIFDIHSFRFQEYQSDLRHDHVEYDRRKLIKALKETGASHDKKGVTSLVRLLGLTSPAAIKIPDNPGDANNQMLNLILSELEYLKVHTLRQAEKIDFLSDKEDPQIYLKNFYTIDPPKKINTKDVKLKNQIELLERLLEKKASIEVVGAAFTEIVESIKTSRTDTRYSVETIERATIVLQRAQCYINGGHEEDLISFFKKSE